MSTTHVGGVQTTTGVSSWKQHPTLYEINTWVWLTDLNQKYGKTINLSSVPSTEWDAIAAYGFDAVWFMGVWERSPAGIAIANQNNALLQDFFRALPDFRIEDNVGSPYCVRRYVVDQHLGGPEGLAIARRELSKRGLNLVLDFVPNHVAPDHPWVAEHPEYFIRGTSEDVRNDPASYIKVGPNVCACGRDPYFPAWPDVLQLNAFEPRLRQAVIETISSIAQQCDGIRCDMAMLFLNPIFERTWGGRAGGATRNRVLGGCDLRHQERVPRLPVYCRGLLGPGVGAAATGLRLLLRQEALRSDGTHQCREHPCSSLCRPCVPKKTASLHRESRRATGRDDLFTF